MKQKKSIIISITSDIGEAVAYDWQSRSDKIVGTYRSKNKNYKDLNDKDFDLISLDILDTKSIDNCIKYISKYYDSWDKLIFCPASLEPIGRFEETEFDDWANSLTLNFTSQMRILHALLPFRNRLDIPSVIFFAGGGTNNATLNYSAYTVSKIATIKMTELLDAEMDDVKFIIYGPGWVKTKIHNATLKYSEESQSNYQKTIDKLKSNECTPYSDIIDSINWGINCEKKTISGRNISIVDDKWATKDLEKALEEDINMYKLRRDKNDWN